MNPDFLMWPLALLCLWTPSAVMFSARVREKLRNPARRRDEGLVSLLRSGANWVDLARGALGGWLVQHEVQGYRAGQDDIAMVFMAAQFGVLLVGVAMQTIWIDRPVRVIGPAFFVTGLTLTTSGPLIGGFALLLGFTCALMLRRLSLGFVFVPASLIAFSALFHEFSATIVLNVLAFALPTVLAFALGVRMAFVRLPVALPSRSRQPDRPEVPALPEPREATVLPPRFRSSRAKAAAVAAARLAEGRASHEVLELGLPPAASQGPRV